MVRLLSGMSPVRIRPSLPILPLPHRRHRGRAASRPHQPAHPTAYNIAVFPIGRRRWHTSIEVRFSRPC